MKIINIVGARPNFMKIAPLMATYAKNPDITAMLVHTGQHYDEKMSHLFFRQLGIPQPDINLGVGGGSQATQTAEIMKSFEPVVLKEKPDAVLVVGDVTSTVACGIVAAKLGVKLIHVEAGLRSRDRSMPEELNRLLTDSITDLFFCTEEEACANLRQEGHDPSAIHMVGNLMIDTLMQHRSRAEESPILHDLALTPGGYAVLTLHRPANVDDPTVLAGLLDAVGFLQDRVPVIFPIHPRTRKNLMEGPLRERVVAMHNLRLLEPQGYLDFLKLTAHARLVLTDSGGIQEETTILGVPCLTLRDNTERPITCTMGTNRLVGTKAPGIIIAIGEALDAPHGQGKIPPMWDGLSAQRIVTILRQQSW